MSKKHFADGYVIGHCWGGGRAAYPSRHLENTSKGKLLSEARQMLDDGSLDSGMGYESLIGACLEIRTETTILVEGKEFANDEFSIEFIGKLKKEERELLLDYINQ